MSGSAIIGTDGPALLLSGQACAHLLSQAGLDAHRRNHRGENPIVDEILQRMTIAALAWREAANGTKSAAPAELDTESLLTTNRAGNLLGVGDRAIRKAIQRQQLRATRTDSGHYLISRTDFELYRAARAARKD